MKNSIKWHTECLKNSQNSAQRYAEEYKRMGERLMKINEEIALYQKQIDRAIKLGKDGFDSDKFKP